MLRRPAVPIAARRDERRASACGEAFSRARPRRREESGFTLVELLVVCLLVGVLAAIAIPAFIGQQAKGKDAQAKVLARSAQTAAEALATDSSGSYASVSPAELNRIEPMITIAPSATVAYLSAAGGSADEYTVTATATDGDELTISREASGVVTRTCASPVTKTGCSGGESGTW